MSESLIKHGIWAFTALSAAAVLAPKSNTPVVTNPPIHQEEIYCMTSTINNKKRNVKCYDKKVDALNYSIEYKAKDDEVVAVEKY